MITMNFNTRESLYRSSSFDTQKVFGGDEDIMTWFTHFLLAHSKKLTTFVIDGADDFYDEYKLLVDLYNSGVDAWAKDRAENGHEIGLADTVETDWFLKEAITGYERKSEVYRDKLVRSIQDSMRFVYEKINEELELFFDYSSDYIYDLSLEDLEKEEDCWIENRDKISKIST